MRWRCRPECRKAEAHDPEKYEAVFRQDHAQDIAMVDNPRGAMFRVIAPNQHSRVTNAELFFDLVFVFAITQLSHMLLGRFNALGAVQVTLLFLAVWWVWVYTAWVTNWLDPEQTPVRSRISLFSAGR